MNPDKVKFTAKQIIRDLCLNEANSALHIEDRVFNMVTLPTRFIKFVCEKFDTDVWKVMAIRNEQIPPVYMSVKAILDYEESSTKKAVKAVGFLVNPYLAQAKSTLQNSNEEKAAKFISNHGIEIITVIYGELYNQGVSLEDLHEASIEFYLESGKNQKHLKTLEESADLLRMTDTIKDKTKEKISQAAEKVMDKEFHQDVIEQVDDVKNKAKGFMKSLFG